MKIRLLAFTLATPLMAHADGVDVSRFSANALAYPPDVVDCELADGSATHCVEITVKYQPDGLAIGPFCPESLDDVGGIWAWDGDEAGTYRLDGAFFRMLTEQGFNFHDENGKLYITDPAAGSPGQDAPADNSCLEASADETVTMTALIPLTPVVADSPTALGTVAQVGIGIDGVPIFADAPSALQTGGIPALDVCGGHVDPGGWYHWHATATDIQSSLAHEGVDADCSQPQSASALFGYAFDGYGLYGSADADGSIPTDLDACNGHVSVTAEHPDGVYHYHAGLDFPNLPPCLIGVVPRDAFSTTASRGIGSQRGGGQGPGDGPGNAPGGRPDFDVAAEKLGISATELRDAIGGPPPNFDQAAEKLGVSADEIREALGER